MSFRSRLSRPARRPSSTCPRPPRWRPPPHRLRPPLRRWPPPRPPQPRLQRWRPRKRRRSKTRSTVQERRPSGRRFFWFVAGTRGSRRRTSLYIPADSGSSIRARCRGRGLPSSPPTRTIAGGARDQRARCSGDRVDIFLQQIVNGLTLGSVYAVVALGYTMLYGIIQLINFAHGEVVMIGAMTSFSVITALAGAGTGLPPVVIVGPGLLVAVPTGMAVGYTLVRVAYRPLA